MDIRCPKCGEPWDIDSLHEEAEYQGRTFDAIRTEFVSQGCGVTLGNAAWCDSHAYSPAANIAALAFEIMGDDIDGVASMLDDAEHWGLL